VTPANQSRLEALKTLSTARINIGKTIENSRDPRSAPVDPNMMRKASGRSFENRAMTHPTEKNTTHSTGKMKYGKIVLLTAAKINGTFVFFGSLPLCGFLGQKASAKEQSVACRRVERS
jgi:hypothetical protein